MNAIVRRNHIFLYSSFAYWIESARLTYNKTFRQMSIICYIRGYQSLLSKQVIQWTHAFDANQQPFVFSRAHQCTHRNLWFGRSFCFRRFRDIRFNRFHIQIINNFFSQRVSNILLTNIERKLANIQAMSELWCSLLHNRTTASMVSMPSMASILRYHIQLINKYVINNK